MDNSFAITSWCLSLEKSQCINQQSRFAFPLKIISCRYLLSSEVIKVSQKIKEQILFSCCTFRDLQLKCSRKKKWTVRRSNNKWENTCCTILCLSYQISVLWQEYVPHPFCPAKASPKAFTSTTFLAGQEKAGQDLISLSTSSAVCRREQEVETTSMSALSTHGISSWIDLIVIGFWKPIWSLKKVANSAFLQGTVLPTNQIKGLGSPNQIESKFIDHGAEQWIPQHPLSMCFIRFQLFSDIIMRFPLILVSPSREMQSPFQHFSLHTH